MKDEALKKAEHALEGVLQVPEKISMMYILDVVRFIREALAQPQQEPDAIGCKCLECGEWQRSTPSGMTCKNGHGGVQGINYRLYTSPPARKPLTDEEIESMWIGSVGFLNPMLNQHTRLAFARAIEAAHNIKGDA